MKFQDSRDGAHQGRFAGTGRAGQADEIACLDLDRHPVQTGDDFIALLEKRGYERIKISLKSSSVMNTIAAYRRDLQQFAAWLAGQSIDLEAVERATVRDYIGSRRDRGLSARSAARALSTLRSFFRFLLRTEVLSTDPTLNLRSPSLWKTVPHALTPEEIESLLAAPDTSTDLGVRDRAMIETLYSTGLRVSERVSLTLERTRLDPGFVRIIGKGRKERAVPVLPVTIKAILRYVDLGAPGRRSYSCGSAHRRPARPRYPPVRAVAGSG